MDIHLFFHYIQANVFSLRNNDDYLHNLIMKVYYPPLRAVTVTLNVGSLPFPYRPVVGATTVTATVSYANIL